MQAWRNTSNNYKNWENHNVSPYIYATFMRLQFLYKTPEGLALFSAALVVLNMSVAPFLLSVGMWGLVIAAIWHLWRLQPEAGLWGALRSGTLNFVRNRSYLSISLLFVVVLLSGLWSEEYPFWLDRTRVRLPFLVLPWAFANFPPLNIRQYTSIIYLLVLSLILLAAGSMVNFWLDTDTVLGGLGEGQPVPVLRQHIRFSLMIVVGVLSGGWLVSKADYWSSNQERRWFAIGIAFLFVVLHILSVRSALVAMYAALAFTVFRYLYLTRQWKQGIIAIVFLAMAPVIAYQRMESLQQRIAYMVYDWQHFNSKDGGESYSDSERFISLYVGVQMWLENPLLGVGTGDLETEILKMTERLYPRYAETPKLPHNQFIYILAATGIFGAILSLIAFLLPLFQLRYRSCYLFVVFQVVIFVSFLVEYTLETSIGAAFYLFYLLWWMKMSEVFSQD